MHERSESSDEAVGPIAVDTWDGGLERVPFAE
jgi:hypothetical protein